MEDLDVYSYLDYREVCRDFYDTKKKTEKDFSYRSFARKAKIASSYLKHVIDGRRNLSSEMSIKFARGMDFDAKQVDYFENLVRFNQADTLDEKTIYFERLRKKRAKQLRPIGLAEAAGMLSNWYVIAIKELVVNLNTIDTKIIQQVLRRKLPESLIESTIHYLLEMGWISQDKTTWSSSVGRIQFPDEVRSYVIRSFHAQMLEIAVEALGDDLTEREFQSTTFTIPGDKVPELKAKIKDLQDDLVAYIQDVGQKKQEGEEKPKIVYHFGMQCFALQKNLGKEARGETN